MHIREMNDNNYVSGVCVLTCYVILVGLIIVDSCAYDEFFASVQHRNPTGETI